MVEGRPETANEIPGDQGNPNVNFRWAKLDDVFSCFKVIFVQNALVMRFSPEFYGFTKGVEVYFRPFDFPHYSFHWWHAETIQHLTSLAKNAIAQIGSWTKAARKYEIE